MLTQDTARNRRTKIQARPTPTAKVTASTEEDGLKEEMDWDGNERWGECSDIHSV